MNLLSSETTLSRVEQTRIISLPAWCVKTIYILLLLEPVFVIPILAYSYLLTASVVPGPSWFAWVGLVIASIPFSLRKIYWGYFSIRSAFEIPAAK